MEEEEGEEGQQLGGRRRTRDISERYIFFFE